MELFELIRKLAVLHGPSGCEKAVSDTIAELASPLVDEVTTDVMGNLIAHKAGTGPRLMLAAHMDTIGLVATFIEESGAVRVGALGDFQAEDTRSALVQFANGTVGTVKVYGKAERKSAEELYVDIGAANREEALSKVQPGDTAVLIGEPKLLGNRILGTGLDGRAACAVLLKAMEEIKSSRDLYFVFTAQEELGHRGAKAASFTVAPEQALVVETTEVLDAPGAKKITNASLGGGAAIKVMDKSIICHPSMVEKLTRLAKEGQLTHQLQVTSTPGTDGGAIHQSRSGVRTGVVSVPCRYRHTPAEMIQLSDAEACVKLVSALANSQD